MRLVSLRRMADDTAADLIAARAKEQRAASTDRLRLGVVKIVVDGSIQGFSARLRWPGYYNGAPNGLWYVAPEQLRAVVALALAQGVQIHAHTNGDEATELLLDCVEEGLLKHPSRDHRFTIQHGQLANAAQFRRMKALGMCINLFPNHHFYWGDQHYTTTVGPERAERMNACATALATGVSFAIHSDAPVTPMGPLFTAWCAENVDGGRPHAGRAGVHRRAGCLAHDHAGCRPTPSSSTEKSAPSNAASARISRCWRTTRWRLAPSKKDVRVWGTVQGGRVFEAPAAP